MDRREFLSLGSVAALLPVLPGVARAGTASGTADEMLDRTFQLIFDEQVANAPRFATQLGLDKGALAPLRHRFDTRPDEQARREEIGEGKSHHHPPGTAQSDGENDEKKQCGDGRGPDRLQLDLEETPNLLHIERRKTAPIDVPDDGHAIYSRGAHSFYLGSA